MGSAGTSGGRPAYGHAFRLRDAVREAASFWAEPTTSRLQTKEQERPAAQLDTAPNE